MEGNLNNQFLNITEKVQTLTLSGDGNFLQANCQIDNLVLTGCRNTIVNLTKITNLVLIGNQNEVKSENAISEICNLFVNGMNNVVMFNPWNTIKCLKFDIGANNYFGITPQGPDLMIALGQQNLNNHFTHLIINNSSINGNNDPSQIFHSILQEVMPVFENLGNITQNDIEVPSETNPSEQVKKKIEIVNKFIKGKYSNYKRRRSHLKEDTCAICLDKYKSKDIVVVFGCGQHIFHQNCLYEWLQKSNLCPLCKFDVMNPAN